MACSRVERSKVWELHFALAPTIAICFFKQYIVRIPILRQILHFIGRHSMNIFLTHTFIRYTFFADFTYSFKYFWLIALVLLAISLGCSIVLELIKKCIRFEKITLWFSDKVVACIDRL